MSYLDALSMHGPRLWDGFLLTVQLTLISGILAFIVAVVLGLMAGSTKFLVRIPARVIIEFFRGTSLLVQLMWLFYVLPLFGPSLGAMLVAVFALTLNYGAYGAEAVRASLTSVPQGQWEATVALSMSWPHKIRRVIFPQAWALMLPSLTNLWVHLLKGSSIVYIIGMSEFTFELLQLRRTTDWFFALAVVGLLVYFLIALVLTQLMRLLEARAKHKLGLGPSIKEILSPVPKAQKAPTEPTPTAGGGR